MSYGIYFDESNKLDQPNGEYSYYGTLGSTVSIAERIMKEIQKVRETVNMIKTFT